MVNNSYSVPRVSLRTIIIVMLLLSIVSAAQEPPKQDPPPLTAKEFDDAAKDLPRILATDKANESIFKSFVFKRVLSDEPGHILGTRQSWLELPEMVRKDDTLMRIEWIRPDLETGKTIYVEKRYLRLNAQSEVRMILNHPIAAEDLFITFVFTKDGQRVRLQLPRQNLAELFGIG